VVPTACVANTRFAGDITAVFTPVMPVPDNVRVCGLPVAVSTIVMDPGRTPSAAGLKFIVMEHVKAGRKFALTQLVLTSRKSPVSYTRLIERDLFPVFVTITDRLPEVPPTGVSGNVTDGEDRDRVVMGLTPVPDTVKL